jgi:Vps51/Vps67
LPVSVRRTVGCVVHTKPTGGRRRQHEVRRPARRSLAAAPSTWCRAYDHSQSYIRSFINLVGTGSKLRYIANRSQRRSLRHPLTMSAEAEAKAQRVRSLLSAYYTNADGVSQGRPGLASIDSAAFDPESYVSSLVRSTSLAPPCRPLSPAAPSPAQEDPPGPTARQVCVHDVRDPGAGQRRAGAQAPAHSPRPSLSPRPQMLVYENYSKFITATDTIRRMKDNVEEMGGRMQDLQARPRSSPCPSPAHPLPSPRLRPPRRPARA